MYINTICLSKYFYDLNFISVLHLNLNFVLILFLYDKRSINRLIAVVEHNTSIAQWQQTETTFNKALYGSEARLRGVRVVGAGQFVWNLSLMTRNV